VSERKLKEVSALCATKTRSYNVGLQDEHSTVVTMFLRIAIQQPAHNIIQYTVA